MFCQGVCVCQWSRPSVSPHHSTSCQGVCVCQWSRPSVSPHHSTSWSQWLRGQLCNHNIDIFTRALFVCPTPLGAIYWWHHTLAVCLNNGCMLRDTVSKNVAFITARVPVYCKYYAEACKIIIVLSCCEPVVTSSTSTQACKQASIGFVRCVIFAHVTDSQ